MIGYHDRINIDPKIDEEFTEVPPMILFFGSEDTLIEYAYETAELSSNLKLDFRLWIAAGQSHGFFNRSPWLESTVYLTDKFLSEHGYLQGDPLIEMPDSATMELYQLP